MQKDFTSIWQDRCNGITLRNKITNQIVDLKKFKLNLI